MAFAAPILLTFLAGLGSFLSPCILPIIPGFLSYLSSSSIKEATESNYENNINENKISKETENINYKQKGSAIVITKKFELIFLLILFILF